MTDIEQIRSNIDITDFGTILRYIDDPETEIDYGIIVLEGDLAEKAMIAIDGQESDWMALMESGAVKVITQRGRPIKEGKEHHIFDRDLIPPHEQVSCLYVPPGYFLKRRMQRTPTT